jgi:hypothetical protein
VVIDTPEVLTDYVPVIVSIIEPLQAICRVYDMMVPNISSFTTGQTNYVIAVALIEQLS